MPVYAYEGRREASGELVQGLKEAASHGMLGKELLSEGVLLTRFEEKRQRTPGLKILSSLLSRVPVLERLLFARYFALMLRAGLDVKRAMAALQEQTRNKAMRVALEAVYQGVERGQTLADSMVAFPQAFSKLFVSFVRVGEATGKLQEALQILSQQLQKDYELRRAVRGGLLYPAVIFVALIVVGIAMMVFVVPRLAEVFQGFDVELPLPTRILIGLSNAFQSYWYLFIALAIIIVGGFMALMRIPSFKDGIWHGMIYVPIIGSIIQRVNLARFSRNLSSLLESGVPFIEALQIMGDNTPHPSYAKIYATAKQHVQQGKPLSDFLKDFKRLFPPLIVHVVRVGEETGELDEVLKETALFFEGEVDQTMKNLTSVLEPVLMVVIGVAVGALAVSVISPIYDLVNVI